jgi:hypothetical protein
MPTSESRRKPQDWKAEGKLFAGLSNFKYLGIVDIKGNRDDNSVKETLEAGNKAYFAHFNTIRSKIISRAAKIKVYETLVRHVAANGAETWLLK